MSDEVLVEQRDGVQIITINRPAAKNSINRAVSLGISEALDALDADPALTLGVITGAGGTFCAGMDLKAFLAGEIVTVEGRGFGGITEKPARKPLIAAVEGWALAGGCEVALSCDLIVAAEDAKFGIPEVKRGLIAAAGGLARLSRRIPPSIAMELALTGDPLPAVEAHRFGLVNQLTPTGGALDAALALAARITPNGPLAITATKEVMVKSADWTLEELWTNQAPIVDVVFASDDAREGASAFAEKRAPRWTGR